MTVTASRLGSAPITLDWSNLLAGTGMGNFRPDAQTYADAWNKLKLRFMRGEVGFYDAPTSDTLTQIKESRTLAEEVLRDRKISDCLFLGIGGSALGPISLLSALQDRAKSGVRFHFLENPDPLDWKAKVKELNPGSTLVCVATKSGTTFETLALFLLAQEWLGKSRLHNHVVAITDADQGDLKTFAQNEGIPVLHITPSIGGRFSVFSPVGLFPAALAGLSTDEFIRGARMVRDYIEKTAFEKNPLFILGHELVKQAAQRPIHVCMPYSTRLKLWSTWFVQLWSESLGKNGKGFTPIAAVGATDQHSILQLMRDGPDDKVTLFLTVDQVEDEVKIPKLDLPREKALSAFKILEGHSLYDLLRIEFRATSRVLTRQGRPNLALQLDRLDEKSLGALYFAFSVLTAFTGTLLDVNPFDQPGVEEGKVYIRESLSQPLPETVSQEDDNSPVGRLRRDRK